MEQILAVFTCILHHFFPLGSGSGKSTIMRICAAMDRQKCFWYNKISVIFALPTLKLPDPESLLICGSARLWTHKNAFGTKNHCYFCFTGTEVTGSGKSTNMQIRTAMDPQKCFWYKKSLLLLLYRHWSYRIRKVYNYAGPHGYRSAKMLLVKKISVNFALPTLQLPVPVRCTFLFGQICIYLTVRPALARPGVWALLGSLKTESLSESGRLDVDCSQESFHL